MRILAKITLGFVAVIVGIVVLYKGAYPTYSHRYRLTIAIEADGQVHTGSSVIEVRNVNQPAPLPEMAQFKTRVRGQAVVIDLESRGAVIAILHSGIAGSVDAGYLATRAYGLGGRDGHSKIAQQTGRQNLAPDNMPSLIWISNVADPRTARVVSINSIPELFGPNARLREAYVEITRDPVTIDIDKKLPWYQALVDRQKGQGVFGRPGQFQLHYSMFIGDGS